MRLFLLNQRKRGDGQKTPTCCWLPRYGFSGRPPISSQLVGPRVVIVFSGSWRWGPKKSACIAHESSRASRVAWRFARNATHPNVAIFWQRSTFRMSHPFWGNAWPRCRSQAARTSSRNWPATRASTPYAEWHCSNTSSPRIQRSAASGSSSATINALLSS